MAVLRAGAANLVAKLVGGGALKAALLFLTAATLGPRLPPVTFALPFFDGWFLRLTDHAKSTSCAVIIGAIKLPMNAKFSEHYVSLSYSSPRIRQERRTGEAADHPLRLRSAHGFPKPEGATLSAQGRALSGWQTDGFDWSSPASRQPPKEKSRLPDFLWDAPGYGSMRVLKGGQTIILKCDLPEGSGIGGDQGAGGRVSLEAEITRPRGWGEGWDTKATGPEGWLGTTGLLPCRYFVQSLGSEATYTLTRTGKNGKGKEVVKGEASAHVESNFGTAFPLGWIYCQVSGKQAGTSLLLVGGKFRIGLANPISWIVALRSPNLCLDMRTTDMHKMETRFSCSRRLVQLVGIDPKTGARVEVQVEDRAEVHDRNNVFVPTFSGFSVTPGCSESFAAVARVKAWLPGPPGSHKTRAPDFHETLPLATLEFGGEFQAEQPAFAGDLDLSL